MKPSGQIEKRLQIVKIAISLTDEEAINLQCSKLRLLKNDKQLDNILSVLDDKNYIQASNLIDRYLHGPYSDTEESAPENEDTEEEEAAEEEEAEETQEKEEARSKEEEELIKKFGLFMEEANKEEYNPIDEEELFSISNKSEPETIPSEEEALTLPPRQPNTEEIMAHYATIEEDNIPLRDTLSPTSAEKRKAQEKPAEKEVEPDKEKNDLSFEVDEVSPFGNQNAYQSIDSEEEKAKYPEGEKKSEATSEATIESKEDQKTEEDLREKKETVEYAPISYIDQKFRNMRNQYPQVEESAERFESEERLLYLISLEGYTEADIEETIERVYSLKNEEKLAEASHLLLIAAATESLYAQFILARELYKGDILQKDLPEAFTQINRLAMNDYPEAICDLAQLYEYGIGIDKDKKKAFSLYEDALELGVDRAEKHLVRMEEASRGILGKLFKR